MKMCDALDLCRTSHVASVGRKYMSCFFSPGFRRMEQQVYNLG